MQFYSMKLILSHALIAFYVTTAFEIPDLPGIPQLPEGVTPDMLDEQGRLWLTRRNPKEKTIMELAQELGPNEKRIWDVKDHYDTKNPPPDKLSEKSEPQKASEKSSSVSGSTGLDPLCKVLESGIVECDGVTQADATDTAKKHLASRMDAETCPEEEGECQAVEAPAEDTEDAETTDERECPLGWLRLGANCYDAAYRMRATQKRAREYCEEVGGALLHPVTEDEASYILNFFHNVWVGAEYNESVEGGWQWLDGSPLPSNASLLGGPKLEPSRRCVRLHTKTGETTTSFVKSRCGSFYSFICRAPIDELLLKYQKRSSAAPAATTGPCPPQWTLISGWCHHTPQLSGEWSNSELWCNQHHESKLVSLLDRQHELAVDALVGGNKSYHIGMRFRSAPKTWGWMNGEKSTYRNWKHGSDPSYAGGDKDVSCAYRKTRKDFWTAMECAAEKLFVCAFKLPEQNDSKEENRSENSAPTQVSEQDNSEEAEQAGGVVHPNAGDGGTAGDEKPRYHQENQRIKSDGGTKHRVPASPAGDGPGRLTVFQPDVLPTEISLDELIADLQEESFKPTEETTASAMLEPTATPKMEEIPKPATKAQISEPSPAADSSRKMGKHTPNDELTEISQRTKDEL